MGAWEIAKRVLAEEKPVDRRAAESGRLAAYGFAGACFIAVTQVSTLAKLDSALAMALGGFSIAIPFLVTAGGTYETLLNRSNATARCTLGVGLFLIFGGLFGVVGMVALFWHFDWKFGLVFLSASLIGIVISLLSHFDLEATEKRQIEGKPDEGMNRQTDGR